MLSDKPCMNGQPVHRDGLVHHSDRGSQYVSIRYIESSVGSVGETYDKALADTIDGAEVIHRSGPWRNFEAVEFDTLTWVSWFNHRRLLEPIGYLPRAEAEAHYWRQQAEATAPTKPAEQAAPQEG